MADQIWSKNTFSDGYSSGDILAVDSLNEPEVRHRIEEENKMGGRFIDFFDKGVKPYLSPADKVLELGPGKGSWTRALFSVVTTGEIHTVDLQDIRPWVQDIIENHPHRFFVHQADIGEDNYDFLADGYFDFFFAFGVFCHINLDDLSFFLRVLRKKLKPDATCVAHYSDWEKAVAYCVKGDGYAYNHSAIEMMKQDFPFEFDYLSANNASEKESILLKKTMGKYPTPAIDPTRYFWVKNDRETMTKILNDAGFTVIDIDTNFFERDPVVVFKPA